MTAVRHWLGAVLTALMAAFPIVALCQPFPVKPVRYLIPDAPGSGNDTIGRIVAAGMAEAFGHSVVVDNRPGAGTTIGFAIGAKAAADGYTIIQNGSGLAAAPSLYRKLPFDPVRDFDTVSMIAKSPQVLVVHPSVPAKSVADLLRLAKERPGKMNYASAGTGSSTFFAMELLKERASVDVVHVPYRSGGAAVTSILSGETSIYFAPVATALPHLKERLRPLAVSTLERLPLLPQLPTIAESGFPGFEAGNWYGLLVPAGTPRQIVAVINRALRSSLKSAEQKLGALAYIPAANSPEEYSAYIKAQIASVAATYKRLGLTPTQ